MSKRVRRGSVGDVTNASHVTDNARKAENRGVGVRRSEGKAVEHVTQEAGKAVSEEPSAPSNKDLGSLSRIPAEAAPSSAPGLPEGLVIEVPVTATAPVR